MLSFKEIIRAWELRKVLDTTMKILMEDMHKLYETYEPPRWPSVNYTVDPEILPATQPTLLTMGLPPEHHMGNPNHHGYVRNNLFDFRRYTGIITTDTKPHIADINTSGPYDHIPHVNIQYA